MPGLVADARDPGQLGVAGLGHPYCEGLLALTNDDEANLAATQAAALLRPDLPVIVRTVAPTMRDRMSAFGTPTVVNPFDRFGDNLRLALRAPASYQLLTWLESGPGAPLPQRGRATRRRGTGWCAATAGSAARSSHDLRAEGLRRDGRRAETRRPPSASPTRSSGAVRTPRCWRPPGIERAAGFIAGTDNDTTNLSLVAAARSANPDLFVAARQNKQASAPLFAAVEVDSLLVPAEVVAHEVYAQLATPLLWRFIREMPACGNDWADRLIGRLTHLCGKRLQSIWRVQLNDVGAPALRGMGDRHAPLGELLRSPDDREERLSAVVCWPCAGPSSTSRRPTTSAWPPTTSCCWSAPRPRGGCSTPPCSSTPYASTCCVVGSVPSSWIWRAVTGRRA